ncbi:DUF4430 domain-containing protein [Senegalia massiliensis]|uniref:DUF4430 domain-containing protein n=1 Tax=Senegalia massiliensis TaxID=1720316 RepID=A0A845QSZ6_9CLOT|nr:DUF4430 domain-containing protein [Senegalia massiliensis]
MIVSKKSLIIVIALVLALGLVFAYQTFLSPESVEGAKEVKIQVINEKEDVDKTFTYNTDDEYLLDLLENNKDEIGVTLTDSDFGKMVTAMMDYEAKESEQEFWQIQVNGKDAETGVAEIPLTDGDKYKFELTSY